MGVRQARVHRACCVGYLIAFPRSTPAFFGPPYPTQAKGGQGGKGPIEKQSREEKTKAEKNKKKSAPVPSVFERVRMIGKDASDKKFS
jgi:hypothetical protein